MSPLLMLDPALTLDVFDHHHSFFNEISLTCREMQIDLRVLASAYYERTDFDYVTPVFKSQTYYFFESFDAYLSKIDEINQETTDDYAKLNFVHGTRILLPTASPWQLQALASQKLDTLKDIRIAVGLLLPSSFWTRDPELQVLLDNITWDAIGKLERTKLFVYSETGYAEGRCQLPIYAPIMSDATLQLCKSLAGQKVKEQLDGAETIVFGFFGGLYKHKGIPLILEASKRAVSQLGYNVVFFVPSQHIDRISEMGLGNVGCVMVDTSPLQYESYLRKMSSVSAVLCCYDKTVYGNQMSGIVTEAAALGVPIIVSRETALQRFLLTYSPGCEVPVEDDVVSLSEVLALPHAYWQEKAKSALVGAPLVRELKSCRRFLTIALGY